MRKAISLFLILVLVFMIPFTGYAVEDDQISQLEAEGQSTECAVMEKSTGDILNEVNISSGEQWVSKESYAASPRASYPIMVIDMDSDLEIVEGAKGELRFSILRQFNNEKYYVDIYNSDGTLIASASGSLSSGGSKLTNVTITYDTAALGMSAGKYKIKYYMEFYTMFEWHTTPNPSYMTLRVLENTCGGNHTFRSEVITPSTCEKEGQSKETCTKCGYEIFEKIPKAEHTYGDAISNGDGTITQTCSICGKKETVKEIYRLAGQTRYNTAMKIVDVTKKEMSIDKYDNIVIASGENFADALAGSYLAHVKKAPILIANGKNNADLKAYISSNLNSGGQIYILGGTLAVPDTLDMELRDYNVKRLAGTTRYETNILILKEAGVTDEEILVCTAQGFADSLSASAVGKPILLVNNNSGKLNETQKAYLSDLKTQKFYVIGGETAVKKSLEEEISYYGSVERIAGSTRYATSVLVANKFFDKPKAVVLAYAENFPDGLCGGPLAMAMDAPVILTKTGRQTEAVNYVRANDISKGYVLGGAGLISDANVKEIFNTKIVLTQ